MQFSFALQVQLVIFCTNTPLHEQESFIIWQVSFVVFALLSLHVALMLQLCWQVLFTHVSAVHELLSMQSSSSVQFGVIFIGTPMQEQLLPLHVMLNN